MARYALKFMFDWGSGTCLWSTNDVAREKYGYPVDIEQLPISSELAKSLIELVDKHDEALDWDCPNNDLLWNEEQVKLFLQNARRYYERLCEEIGEEYSIEFWDGM